MESTTINNDINAIKEVRELFNERRSNLIREERNRIREKLYKKKAIYNFLKEKEQEGNLTNKQKNVLKNIDRFIKNLKTYLKKYLKRFRKYNTTYGLEYLFNEPAEIKQKSNNNINAIKEARELFNELRSNLSREETKRIRKKLHNFLKEKEQEDSLTNKEKKLLKNINRYLKNLKKDLEKLQKYQYNITYGLDYLFNQLNEDYYEPKEIKSAFDGSFML